MSGAAVRRTALAHEIDAIDALLMSYASASGSVVTVPSAPTLPSIEHHAFTEMIACGCAVCGDWRLRHAEFVATSRLVPVGHRWSTCSCPACRLVGRMHLNALAASNRRDVLIEMSFHARTHTRYGDEVMAWTEAEVFDPRYTPNWWSQEAGRFPMEMWFRRCQAAIGPRVSGEVFRDGTMSIDIDVRFGSSLVADGVITV